MHPEELYIIKEKFKIQYGADYAHKYLDFLKIKSREGIVLLSTVRDFENSEEFQSLNEKVNVSYYKENVVEMLSLAGY